jgi:protein transport protein SEC24
MFRFKTLPLSDLLLYIYPALYPVHNFTDDDAVTEEDGEVIPQPPRFPLTYENIESGGAYLMDTGECQYLYVCRAINPAWIKAVFNVPHFSHIQEGMVSTKCMPF